MIMEERKDTIPTQTIDSNWVLSRLKDSVTLDKIKTILAQHGYSIAKPTLQISLEVTTSQILSLDTEDLRKLLSPFGTIESITMQNLENNSAIVVYGDIVSAYLAQQSLNNYPIPSLNAKLIDRKSVV